MGKDNKIKWCVCNSSKKAERIAKMRGTWMKDIQKVCGKCGYKIFEETTKQKKKRYKSLS